VLITHEHGDHVDVLRLIGLGVDVYVPEGVTFEGLPATQIGAGSSVDIAGFGISVVAGRHAYVDGEQPSCVNFGYVIDDSIYHPGDALVLPDRPIETLFVPMYASWLKTAEALEFIRKVEPERAFGIHDAQLNERGLASINSWFGYSGGTDYRWLPPGTSS
jgi:L-ascorbate metabolism protein UlaG (beta-lactamase superfamily)